MRVVGHGRDCCSRPLLILTHAHPSGRHLDAMYTTVYAVYNKVYRFSKWVAENPPRVGAAAAAFWLSPPLPGLL